MRRSFATRLLILPLLLGMPWAVRAQSDPNAFMEAQMADLFRAIGDRSINSRVRNIWLALVRYSGRMYPVVAAQQFNAGQALPNGVVLLDLSIAGNEHREVTAFFLAHEYGHEVLGHPQLTVTPLGSVIAALGGTAQEDAADRWAARFLRANDVALEPVIAFLCDAPGGGPDDTHSDGPTRATNVASVYRGAPVDDVCSGDTPTTETHDVRFRMWSAREGNPTVMELLIDGDSQGVLNNVRGPLETSVDGLTVGQHSFTLTHIAVFDGFGRPVASELECTETFQVGRDRMMRIAASLLPTGEVRCAIQ